MKMLELMPTTPSPVKIRRENIDTIRTNLNSPDSLPGSTSHCEQGAVSKQIDLPHQDEHTATSEVARSSLHIAFAIEGLHNVSGGAERVLADVTRHLYNRGHKITILTHEGYNAPSFYPIKFGIDRIDVWPRHSRRKVRPPLDRARTLGERSIIFATPIWITQYLPRILRLRRALRRIDADVIVGFMPSMFPYSTIAALGLRTRTVVSVHNVPTKEFGADRRRWNQNRLDIRVRRLSLRLADAVTVLLPSFRKEFKRKSLQDKTFVIPNMVHRLNGPLADVRSNSEMNTILAVGRLAEAKDHQSLIEAWAKLEDKYPNWQVKIFGKGPLHDSLSRRIRTLGLKRLAIFEPTSQIMQEYLDAKILAMPSKYEGFGLVTAEALAAGLPVIGFVDCPGTNELIIHGVNGLLANPRGGRARGFAHELDRLIQNEALRVELAKHAPASVEKFSPDVVIDNWEEMLFKVAKVERAHG